MQVAAQRISTIVLKDLLQNFLIGTILVFSVLLVLQQANPARAKLGRDSGAYIYIGSHILRGEPPYLTAWDSKPPGIFLLDAVGLWLGKGTRWGIWLIEAVSLSITASLGFLAMRRHFGLGAALPASLLWLYGLNQILIGGNLTEEYSLLFGFLALFLFSLSLEKNPTPWLNFGMGLCMGVSFLFRPNNTGVQISIFLTVIVLEVFQGQFKNLIKQLFFAGLGILVPLVLMAMYLISQKALQAFWASTILYNFFSYAGPQHLSPLASLQNGITHLGWAAITAILGFLVALFKLLRHTGTRTQINGMIIWIIVDGFVEILFSGLSGRNYRHYFINWLPIVAIASAFLIATAIPSAIHWMEKRALWWLLIFTGVYCILFWEMPEKYWKSFRPLFENSPRVQYIDPISEYVNVHTSPGQKVLVWGGQAGINFLAKRDSPVAYLFYPLGVPSEVTDQLSEDYYQALLSDPPELIVDGHIYEDQHIVPISAKDPLGWLHEHGTYTPLYLTDVLLFIHENYVWEDNIDGTDIYRLQKHVIRPSQSSPIP
ncbi:MAG: glycosyltransferase family 39 protein [Chloroflexi bacterium]|nr:glycosyltransferase family 39 protein [Chloroflexota bacterium]